MPKTWPKTWSKNLAKNLVQRIKNTSGTLISEVCFNLLKRIFGWIFGIRPERGRDGRTGRTGRTDGRTDGTDGRADGRDGRTGRTDGRNTVLQYYWDGEIQYYSTIYYLLFIF